jgi:hypothetical protein
MDMEHQLPAHAASRAMTTVPNTSLDSAVPGTPATKLFDACLPHMSTMPPAVGDTRTRSLDINRGMSSEHQGQTDDELRSLSKIVALLCVALFAYWLACSAADDAVAFYAVVCIPSLLCDEQESPKT